MAYKREYYETSAFQTQICARETQRENCNSVRHKSPWLKERGLSRLCVNTAGPLKLFAYLAGICFDFSARARAYCPTSQRAAGIIRHQYKTAFAARFEPHAIHPHLGNFKLLVYLSDSRSSQWPMKILPVRSFSRANLRGLHCFPIEKLYLLGKSFNGFR